MNINLILNHSDERKSYSALENVRIFFPVLRAEQNWHSIIKIGEEAILEAKEIKVTDEAMLLHILLCLSVAYMETGQHQYALDSLTESDKHIGNSPMALLTITFYKALTYRKMAYEENQNNRNSRNSIHFAYDSMKIYNKNNLFIPGHLQKTRAIIREMIRLQSL